ncbi:MAG: class I SAM-dependent methyltransferase [Candidatus Paceibacterota bacterium]|jgi:ubiquinone/menaquinone biosynthesis C-methylase UbiE
MFTDPVKNLKQFGLKEDMIVADLGAGTGFYSIPAAQMVLKGKVYAIEVQDDFLGIIRNKVKDAGLDNLNCILGDIEKIGGTKIGDGIVDAVIVSNIISQVKDQDKFVEEIGRILKNRGRVLLIDWSEESPLINSKLKTVITKDKALKIFESKGFIFERDINTEVHHYGMILIKEK